MTDVRQKKDQKATRQQISMDHGVSDTVLEAYSELSALGINGSFRGGQTYRRPGGAGKPPGYKAKGSNHTLFRGVIPKDSSLGKVSHGKYVETVEEREAAIKIPKEERVTVTHKIELWEIVDAIKKNELKEFTDFEYAQYKIERRENVHLYTIPSDASDLPDNIKGKIFCIDSASLTECSETGRELYDVQEFDKKDKKFKDVEVYAMSIAMEDEFGNDQVVTRPITGDVDGLIMLFDISKEPCKTLNDKYPWAFDLINTDDEGGIEKLMELHALVIEIVYNIKASQIESDDPEEMSKLEELKVQRDEVIDSLEHITYSKKGTITPLGMFFSHEMNLANERAKVENGGRKISGAELDVVGVSQHGDENNYNPKPMAHAEDKHKGEEKVKKKNSIDEGAICIDEIWHNFNTEIQLAQILIGAVPPNRFSINQNWDMESFGPVIKKQIESGFGMDVSKETFKAYEVYNANKIDILKEEVSSLEVKIKELGKETKTMRKETTVMLAESKTMLAETKAMLAETKAMLAETKSYKPNVVERSNEWAKTNPRRNGVPLEVNTSTKKEEESNTTKVNPTITRKP